MASQQQGINGDPAALLIDRAINELRRGRAIALVDESRDLMIVAVETLTAALWSRLASFQTDRNDVFLVLTRQRANTLGIAVVNDYVCLPVPTDLDIDELHALIGAGNAAPPIIDSSPVDLPELRRSIETGLKLAKAGRLMPAMLALPSHTPVDESVLKVPVHGSSMNVVATRSSLQITSRAQVPLADAVECEISVFRDDRGTAEHVAVVIGKPNAKSAIPVRLHSSCLTGDLLGSLRCDCGEQLRTAVTRIASLGGGILLYLDQEGRGIGLPNKLRAYALQDSGLDTLDADQHLGFLADERNYDVAAIMLKNLGIKKIQLLTNNPQKIAAMNEHGIEVAGRLSLIGTTNSHNERYIRAKRERAGHLAEESGR